MHAQDPDDWSDEPQALPDPDALLAATLSLMSAWAHPTPPPCMATADWQRVVARKVASNLFFLAHHPRVRGPLATVLHRLHGQWSEAPEAAPTVPPVAASTALH